VIRKKPSGVDHRRPREATALPKGKRKTKLDELFERSVAHYAEALGIAKASQNTLDEGRSAAVACTKDDKTRAITDADAETEIGGQQIATLAQIEHAMERKEEGNYGSCEGCGINIPMPRMNAIPWATTCVECQTEEEAK